MQNSYTASLTIVYTIATRKLIMTVRIITASVVVVVVVILKYARHNTYNYSY